MFLHSLQILEWKRKKYIYILQGMRVINESTKDKQNPNCQVKTLYLRTDQMKQGFQEREMFITGHFCV